MRAQQNLLLLVLVLVMADVSGEPESSVVDVLLQVFTEFRRRLVWREWPFVPRSINVGLQRANCESVCRKLTNSTAGRTHLYTALLSAISNNEVTHFNSLLAITEDVLSLDDVLSTARQWRPIHNRFDEDLVWENSFLCHPSIFSKYDMIASLLQYAVLCGCTSIVEILLPRVEDVSSISSQWCPFLVKGFSCTPLWLAAFQHHYSIMKLLLMAGASPYEAFCSEYQPIGHDSLPLTILSRENHLVTHTLLDSQVNRRRQFPVSLILTARIVDEGSDWLIDFLESTFQWNSVVSPVTEEDSRKVISHFARIPGLWTKVLELPCHSEEDIIRKQAICVELLLYIVRFEGWRRVLGYRDRTDHEVDVIIRNLVRHGASACGFTASTSTRFVANYWKTFLRREKPTMYDDPLIGVSAASSGDLFARCAHLQQQRTATPPNGHHPWYMEYPPERGTMTSAAVDMAYIWTGLQETRSIENPAIRELFHCGALPHVKSLECVPFSTRDNRIHDGPTCQCDGIELSAMQRKMSIAELFQPPSIVSSLQAACRTTIINSCQGHGVVPAIRQLPIPSQLIEYMLYNVNKDNHLFRH